MIIRTVGVLARAELIQHLDPVVRHVYLAVERVEHRDRDLQIHRIVVGHEHPPSRRRG